uniref:anhydro-N-acetylmuramic acid kinase n=1 Tax=Roseivirga sp. TaxID=1964215 RepID=UPI004047D5C4
MLKDDYKVIGLMSGTSLDGLDIAYCSFTKEAGKWHFKLIQSEFVAYTDEFRDQLKNSIDLSAIDLLVLNNQYGEWLGQNAKRFIDQHQLEVDFIASHGHTVFHQIDKKLTYQIGNGQTLANASGQKVICDFRSLDVSLGGQGAPLVPIGDKLLFSEYDFCLNLGGISNVSFDHLDKRIAFDIAPVNMLLSHMLKSTGLPYDDGGNMAKEGKLSKELFDALNALPYYQLPFPKSLGYEWFVGEVVPILNRFDLPIADLLCSGLYHIAFQIATCLGSYAPCETKMLVTGGGVKNHFLIEILKKYLKDEIEVVIPSSDIIDFKEAIVFAFMGVLRDRGEINSLKSVTGAAKDASGGIVFQPN